MAKILFLTTAHHYNDDRIFYHQAIALKETGNQVKICSLSSEFQGDLKGIKIESFNILKEAASKKIDKFVEVCKSFRPDLIIASEPLAIIAAKKYFRKIPVIYDITEWYPSNRMVANFSGLKRCFKRLQFHIFNIYAGFLSDGFIFGEPAKKFPLANLFPFKKNILLPYFPDEKYIAKSIRKLHPDQITLGYTGTFSEEKGIANFFAAADALRRKKPESHLSLLLIGKPGNEENRIFFENLIHHYQFENLEIRNAVPFVNFTEAFSEADILFDLREKNSENDRCLPIKIFYYAAAGKPVIFTDLQATRDFMNVSEFGFLVNPEDSEKIANHIITYLESPELYLQHAEKAVKNFEEKYNWNAIRPTFISFIEKMLRK